MLFSRKRIFFLKRIENSLNYNHSTQKCGYEYRIRIDFGEK